MTALDVKHAKQALAWRLQELHVPNAAGHAGAFIDDLVSRGWQMSPDREARRQPPKAVDQCRTHPGEYAASCRLCAVNDITRPDDPVIDDPSCTAGLALLADIRARKAATTPEPEQGAPDA